MNRLTNLEKVRMHLGTPELLTQLAEECSELAQAALKLRRSITGINPTPMVEEVARSALIEEIADLFVCLDALGIQTDEYEDLVIRIWDEKMARWAKRLEEKALEEVHG